jgi:hypothetical protein
MFKQLKNLSNDDNKIYVLYVYKIKLKIFLNIIINVKKQIVNFNNRNF